MLKSTTRRLEEHFWGGRARLSSCLFLLLRYRMSLNLLKDLYGITTDPHPCSKKSQSLKRSLCKCTTRVGSSETDCSSHVSSQSLTKSTSRPWPQHLSALQKEPDAVWKHRPLPLYCLPTLWSSDSCSLKRTLTYYQNTANEITQSS